jgi:hypothetical protein
MSEKPISPLRQRMIEDMTVRNFIDKSPLVAKLARTSPAGSFLGGFRTSTRLGGTFIRRRRPEPFTVTAQYTSATPPQRTSIHRALGMRWVDFGPSPWSEIRPGDVDRLNSRLRHRVTTVTSWGVLRTGRATGVSRNQSTNTMHAIDTRPSIPNVSAHAIT